MIPASIFHYLSWLGYLGLAIGVLVVVLGIVVIVPIHRAKDPARVEKTIRYLGLTALLETAAFVTVFFNWALGHGFIAGTGKLNLSKSEGYTLVWGLVGGTVAYGSLFLISGLMKRKRQKQAMAEMLEMYMVLESEYGPDEAQRIMEKAGHDKKWLQSYNDY